MRTCDLCGIEEAIYTDHIRGISLCKDCLLTSVRRRAWEVLESELLEGDRIMVAHSGGKDSSLALFLTKAFLDEKKDMRLSLISVSIDEGTFYRRASIEIAKRLADELGVRHITYSIEDIHGISIDEVHEHLPDHWNKSACTYCGVLRRQSINAVARELGATVVVTGHNLDDVIQTALMNLARGDISALVKALRHERRYSEGMIPRVRPLKYVYEREVASLVLALEIPAHLGKCPLTQGMRIGVRREIDLLEDRSPGAKLRALGTFLALARGIEARVEMGRCEICGEPTTQKVCKACQMKMELSKLTSKNLLGPLRLEGVPTSGVWGDS